MADNKPKKQHYVPCAYLAQFSANPRPRLRKSKVYRTDNNIENRLVPVETQCFKEFYYEEDDTQKVEDELKTLEDELQKIIGQCNEGMPKQRELKLLMLHHAYMFSRGEAVENVSSTTKYTSYNNASNLLLAHYFYDQPITDLRNKDFANYLFNNYGSLVLTSKGESLITSDNPVIVFQTLDGVQAALSFMPLTSHRISILFHKSYVRAKPTKLDTLDVANLNALQAMNSYEAIFSFDELPEKDLVSARKCFGKRRYPKVQINDKGGKFDLPLVSTVAKKFSFIRELY